MARWDEFVDLLGEELGTVGYLMRGTSYSALVISPYHLKGIEVSPDKIAGFCTSNVTSTFDFQLLVSALKHLNFPDRLQSFLSCSQSPLDHEFTQVYAGILPAVIQTSSCHNSLVESACERFPILLPSLRKETVLHTWTNYWRAVQMFLKSNLHIIPRYVLANPFVFANTSVIVTAMLQTVALARDLPCITTVFPLIQKWLQVEETQRGREVDYALSDIEAAAQVYLTYCIRTLKLTEAMETLALALKSCLKQAGRDLDDYLEFFFALFPYFKDFPGLMGVKTDILHYIFRLFPHLLSLSDILDYKLVDEPTLDLLIQSYPLSAVQLFQLIAPKFNLFVLKVQLKSLKCVCDLAEKLQKREEIALCWDLRATVAMEWLKPRKAAQRILRFRLRAVISVIGKRLFPRLPKTLIFEVANLAID